MLDFLVLAQQCAPTVHPQTMAAVAHVESSFNPFAIGVVGGRLERQPVNKAEAVMTAKALEDAGYNFSLGVGQVNRYNLTRYGLDYDAAFEPCANLHAASLILKDCYDRALTHRSVEQEALQAAFSCYYSGNFSTGFAADFQGQPSFVEKVLRSAGGGAAAVAPIRVVPNGRSKAASRSRITKLYRLTVEAPASAASGSSVYGGSTSASVMVYR